MARREYATPLAFKQALEARLRATASTGVDFARRRQLLIFDRFLARLFQVLGDAVILKGGLALELRLARARTTKDVDLRVTGSTAEVLTQLQAAGRLDLGDNLRFEVQPDEEQREIRNEGMVYEGYRYRAVCRLAGVIYGRPFGVDVAFGDPLVGEPDRVVGEDWLAFAGIPPAAPRLYPVASHVAEKLHAMTLPRARPNSRVRDLPDLALLATVGEIAASTLRQAISATFDFRGSHAIPGRLPPPPAFWAEPYGAMAEADELPWKTLAEVTAAAAAFLDPVLAGATVAVWSPADWRWTQPR